MRGLRRRGGIYTALGLRGEGDRFDLAAAQALTQVAARREPPVVAAGEAAEVVAPPAVARRARILRIRSPNAVRLGLAVGVRQRLDFSTAQALSDVADGRAPPVMTACSALNLLRCTNPQSSSPSQRDCA